MSKFRKRINGADDAITPIIRPFEVPDQSCWNPPQNWRHFEGQNLYHERIVSKSFLSGFYDWHFWIQTLRKHRLQYSTNFRLAWAYNSWAVWEILIRVIWWLGWNLGPRGYTIQFRPVNNSLKHHQNIKLKLTFQLLCIIVMHKTYL